MASVAAERPAITFEDDATENPFRDDVLAGLAQERKAIPARWFYDMRGSQLFEDITRLPEYYPTRAEVAALQEHGAALGEAIGEGRIVVEFGAGSSAKTPLLLDRIAPSAYVPIDISGDFLRESCEGFSRRYPELPVFPIEADFTRPVPIPSELLDHERLGFFPGSTIGNLEPDAAVDLLREMHRTLGSGSLLLIGMDRIKDRETLVSAYDDAAGVTAAFNLNLVHRINRELDGTIPVDAIRHKAVWNPDRARIEMHLEATREIRFQVCGRTFSLRAGESVHTENSHKYDEPGARTLLLAGGWEPLEFMTDAESRFMIVLARAMGDGITP
ncbi:L-histidine N(alpha)-methyltransferase [Novosphingobium aquimarinum]|uniref:L-histidine N(alpha)-methyltransferase n=1 Tax=Novosphingobium aquimarinum TaxID=2682494 RepID=UPI0012EC1621|nr:L-histidine N(alpha)-methyltransferase [Novosphingobium aquimarinum]